MNKKIFKSICFATLTVFIATLILIMGALTSYFTNSQKRQLKNETDLAAQGVMLNGKEYFEGLDEKTDYRITWVNADGSVIYDNEADPEKMENHLERAEIKQALENGYGESARYSSTLSEKLLYSARRLPDKTVLRLSFAQSTIWTLLMGFAAPICGVAMLATVMSLCLATSLSKRIIEPINTLDLDEPMKNEIYEELEPLMKRIDVQQKQLKADRAALEKTEQIRQEFTANVSHELKTPLQAISGYAELIKAGIVKPEDIKPFAEKIYSESHRLSTLVEDIIDLTKLDNGGYGYQWEETDLYRIAENVIDSLESEAETQRVKLNLEGSSTKLYGVAQLLHSIVYNLCDNAIKYNHENGEVNIKLAKDAERVVLTVSDTGIGIPKECIDRIFERFYRVDKSRSKEVGGTGLGLSIVKHAALIMNADVSLDSKEGKGSTFTISFPERN